jgi:hypothetical protein
MPDVLDGSRITSSKLLQKILHHRCPVEVTSHHKQKWNNNIFTRNPQSVKYENGIDLAQLSDGETTYFFLLAYTFAHLVFNIT